MMQGLGVHRQAMGARFDHRFDARTRRGMDEIDRRPSGGGKLDSAVE